jgi:hypothetical protein
VKKIKKFEPLSVMRISAIGYGAMGLLEGAIFSVMFSMIPMMDPQHQTMPRWTGMLFGGFAIVLFPILFAIMGAIAGGLGAVIYNVSARFVGGIVVEVE